MQFKSLRVRNYRSIGNDQTVEIPESLTVVGPNNSGKTNLLRAVRLFFTGFESLQSYERSADLTFGKSREQTTLVGVFRSDGRARDLAVLEIYDKLLALYDPPRVREADEIQLQLIFSLAGKPTYRLSSDSTSKVPRENQGSHSRLLRMLVDELISGHSVHYVPSSSSSEELFEDLVSPLLRASVANRIQDHVQALIDALEIVSVDLTNALSKTGLSDLAVKFGVPDPKAGLFLSYFDFSVSDPDETSVFDKGRGIQALAMFACFAWIAEQENREGLSSLWLIEEPESYLNPDLYSNALGLIARIRSQAQVVITTHALGMVPTEPALIVGSELDGASRTQFVKFSTAQEATASLRASLGVRFSDFFALTEFNVFTEGESDIRYLKWAINALGGPIEFPILSVAGMRSFGGTSDMKAFLQSNYAHIRPERAVVSMFDGDVAGVRAVRDLTGYLGNKGSGFESNVDYVVVRNGSEIEGLFPDSYILEAHLREAAWFDEWTVDAAGELVAFHIRDQSKRAVGDWLVARSTAAGDTDEWSTRWLPVLNAIEHALTSWRPGRH